MFVQVLLVSQALFAGRSCPNNDFKACSDYLSQAHKVKTNAEFIEAYDVTCETNSKFKCVKITVLADTKKTLKEVAEERPKAHLFVVEQKDGKYIYSFEKK